MKMLAKDFVEKARKSYPKLPTKAIWGLVSSKRQKNEFGEKIDLNVEFREEVCKQINRSLSEKDHKMIRYLFKQEIKSNVYGCGFSENMRRCAYMLFKMGKVEDVPLIWEAKCQSNAISKLDVQFLIGAGLEQTIGFLQSFKDQDSYIALKYIEHSISFGEFDFMEQFKLSMANLFDIF